MKPPIKASLEPYLSRAERVFAIKQAVQAGSYKVDSSEVASILVSHLLSQAMQWSRTSPKRQCSLN